MGYRVEHSGSVIHCATATDVVELVQAFQVAGIDVKSGVQSGYVAMTPEQRLSDLLDHLKGTNQAKFLSYVLFRPGVTLNQVRADLDLEGFKFNGVWSGLSRNCRKFGLLLELIIQRERDKDGFVRYYATDLLNLLRNKMDEE